MYQGKNPIAIRTQQWLVQGLITLMKEKPYSSITILDLCKEADLSRQTFYNFFSSKDEILHFCLQTEYQKQFSKCQNIENLSIEEIIESFSIVLTNNAELLSLMLKNGLDGIITDEISKCITLFADCFCDNNDDKEILSYSKALLSGALAHLLVFWFGQNEPISTKKLTDVLKKFFTGDLYTFSNRE